METPCVNICLLDSETGICAGCGRSIEEIARWAALHHERPDGKGYPFGLKAESLPLGVRIVAVADVFTAITEDRPYRRKLSREQALHLLEGEAAHNIVDGTVVNALKEIT